MRHLRGVTLTPQISPPLRPEAVSVTTTSAGRFLHARRTGLNPVWRSLPDQEASLFFHAQRPAGLSPFTRRTGRTRYPAIGPISPNGGVGSCLVHSGPMNAAHSCPRGFGHVCPSYNTKDVRLSTAPDNTRRRRTRRGLYAVSHAASMSKLPSSTAGMAGAAVTAPHAANSIRATSQPDDPVLTPCKP